MQNILNTLELYVGAYKQRLWTLAFSLSLSYSMILLIISPRVNSSRTKKNKKLKWLKVDRKQVSKKKKRIRNPAFWQEWRLQRRNYPWVLATISVTEAGVDTSKNKTAGLQKESRDSQLKQEVYFSNEISCILRKKTNGPPTWVTLSCYPTVL